MDSHEPGIPARIDESPAGTAACGCGTADADTARAPDSASNAVQEGVVCGPACVEVGACCGAALDVASAAGETVCAGGEYGRPPAPAWAREECTLDQVQRSVRMAEFGALFARALGAVSRPEPTRLRLLLDRAHEGAARDLAIREGACCSFFTFAFTHPTGGGLYLDVMVPIERRPVLDGLVEQAATVAAQAGR